MDSDLRRLIDEGIAQLDDGHWSDEETVFAELNAEIDAIESAQA